MANSNQNGSWPVTIVDGDLILRPLRIRDRKSWDRVREVNQEWLGPWEATRPQIDAQLPLPTYFEMIRTHRLDGKRLRSIALGIWLKESGREIFVGQITLGGIVLGAMRGAHIGYWIDQRVANRGITSRAVLLLTKFAFNELRLHRIEISMRPENSASKRVAEKAGYYFEGSRLRFLHIDGAWRDHITYVKENGEIR